MNTSGLFPNTPVARQLKLDPSLANREIQLTYDTKAQLVRHHQSYADRFHCSQQLLCTAAVSPGCYWEVEWRGLVEVGVAYHSIQRKGSEADCSPGRTRGVVKPEPTSPPCTTTG